MKRELSVDLAKIVAMYFVLALHIFVATDLQPCFLRIHWWSIFGIAIPMFFMASGYLMYKKNLTYGYVGKKVAGILRFVFITITPFVLFLLIKGDGQAWKQYIYWFFQKGLFNVYWYFGAMILIYLLAPPIKRIVEGRLSKYFMGGVFLICHVVFFLNVHYDFERNCIPQTFRIWNWILYFSIGMLVNKYKDKVMCVKWWHAILAAGICIGFMFLFRKMVRGNEYYFCSFPCMLYSSFVFARIVCLDISESMAITRLSKLFLPIYSTHIILYGFWKKYVGLSLSEPNINFIVNYFLVAILVTVVSYIIMKIPKMDKVFKI